MPRITTQLPGPQAGDPSTYTHVKSGRVEEFLAGKRGSAYTCPLPIPNTYVTASSAIPLSSRSAASISASAPGPYLDVVSRQIIITTNHVVATQGTINSICEQFFFYKFAANLTEPAHTKSKFVFYKSYGVRNKCGNRPRCKQRV